MFERPVALWLLLALALVAIPGALAVARGSKPFAASISTVLRIATFVALVLMLAGVNETEGQVLDEVPAMSQAGIRIFTAAPPPSAIARVAISSFEAPAVVRAETSFALHLDIDSEARSRVDAQISLSSDGTP